MNQDLRQFLAGRRINWKRIAVVLTVSAVIVAWGSRAVTVIADGWCASRQALQKQQQIRANDQQIDDLHRQVDYAKTDEGQAVEAKRRFRAMPRNEIRLKVDADGPPPRPGGYPSVADHVNEWLAHAGSRFIDRLRHFGAIMSYWLGCDEVDTCVVVPEVDESSDEEPSVSSDDTKQSDGAGGGGTDDEAAP